LQSPPLERQNVAAVLRLGPLTEQILEKEKSMTAEEQIAKMTAAIRQAIKVMGDRFGSTEQDVARAIQDLKVSMQVSSEPSAILRAATAGQPINAG